MRPAQPFAVKLLGLSLLLLTVACLTTCSDDDSTTPDTGADGLIGSGGGSVSDAGGAQVEIPAGALSQDTAITVTTYTDPDEFPVTAGPVPAFWGGAEFGPSGTEFALPVTISIPARVPLTPGTEYPLFVYEPDSLRWDLTSAPATVSATGDALVAEVEHFSVFSPGGSPGGAGDLSDIDANLCDGDPTAICNAYIAYFKSYIADVGDKGLFDGECKEVVGLYMDVAAEIVGVGAFVPVRDGEFRGETLTISYQADCGTGNDAGGFLDAISTIYYECTAPALSAVADPDELQPGGSSTVTATLACGQQAYPGQSVQFECFGIGQIDQDAGTTNPAGQAQTMYSVEDEDGEATVRAYYDACAGHDNAATITNDALITVSGSWSGSLVIIYDHQVGGSPLDAFYDVVTIDFDLEIEEGSVSGSGSGYHIATVTPGGDCWNGSLSAPAFEAIVLGSATETSLEFQVLPISMPLSFVITCHSNDPQDYSYPVHGMLEGAILGQYVVLNVPLEDGGTDMGEGTDDWGEDIPVHYSYTVTISQGGD